MDTTAEIKNSLHELIVETNDIDILTQMKAYFRQLKAKNVDWWDSIDDASKEAIETGIKQADEGNLVSHQNARKRIDNFLKNNG
jgi:predicted transcriptional regulator